MFVVDDSPAASSPSREPSASLKSPVDRLGRLLEKTVERGGGPLSIGDVVDEVMVILFAGHDTTASWLNSALAVLGSPQYADVQDSIRRTLGSERRRPARAGWIPDRSWAPLPPRADDRPSVARGDGVDF